MKLKTAHIFLICFIAASNFAVAQRFADQVPQQKRYTQKEIVDSLEGIKIFNKLIESIGGDSVKYNKSGYNLQGWNEDFYSNGKILHRGYYVDGKLIVFKNFFENGQCERSVVNPDPIRCNLEVFYEDGKQRKQVNYYNGQPQKKYEYYSNGYPKYIEENDKDMKYLTLKKSYFSNGQIENALELTDIKNKKYNLKTYYLSGEVKEEGALVLSNDGKEYNKDGVWHFYDTDGKKKKTEKFTAHTKETTQK